MKSQYLWGHYFWRNYCSCSLSKSQVVKLLGRICFLCKPHQHRSNFQRRLLQTLQTTYLQKGEWNIFCDGNVGDLNSYQNITMRKHARFVFSRHAARCGIRIEKGLGWSCSISSSFFESSFNKPGAIAVKKLQTILPCIFLSYFDRLPKSSPPNTFAEKNPPPPR